MFIVFAVHRLWPNSKVREYLYFCTTRRKWDWTIDERERATFYDSNSAYSCGLASMPEGPTMYVEPLPLVEV